MKSEIRWFFHQIWKNNHGSVVWSTWAGQPVAVTSTELNMVPEITSGFQDNCSVRWNFRIMARSEFLLCGWGCPYHMPFFFYRAPQTTVWNSPYCLFFCLCFKGVPLWHWACVSGWSVGGTASSLHHSQQGLFGLQPVPLTVRGRLCYNRGFENPAREPDSALGEPLTSPQQPSDLL